MDGKSEQCGDRDVRVIWKCEGEGVRGRATVEYQTGRISKPSAKKTEKKRV